MHNILKKLNSRAPLVIAVLFFYVVGIIHLGHFSKMPGDLGDGRLNNYFLENIFLFFIGKSDSLIHLNFFYPFPYILGFSDNLFGMAPAYLVARFLGFQPDTSFQLWFIFGYILNYTSSYYVLKRLSFDKLSSSVGAIIFTYAPPALALINHVQLQYRFCIPLSALYFLLFLKERNLKYFVISMLWSVWQFYCSIYIGFFLFVLLLIILIAYLFLAKKKERNFKIRYPSVKQGITYLFFIALAIGLMLLLFYPYLEVSKLYKFTRSWSEIFSYLPKPRSYLLSDGHIPWRYLSYKIPMGKTRSEHQLFIGFIPLALIIYGLLKLRKTSHKSLSIKIFFWSLFIFIFITFSIREISIWYLFHKLPLFSAIRAVTRIILVMLLPISVVSAFASSKVKNSKIKILIITFLLFELSIFRSPVSKKESWRLRQEKILSCIPNDLKKDAIIYLMTDKNEKKFLIDLDAMIAAQKGNLRTINGYSGHRPPINIDTNGSFPEKFMRGYQKLLNVPEKEKLNLLKRVITINLNQCI